MLDRIEQTKTGKYIAFLTFLLFFLLAGCSEQVHQEESKYTEYANPDVLATPEELQTLMASGEDVLLLDVRAAGNYRRGHIRDAHNIFRSSYLTRSGNGRYGGMNISREQAGALLGELGASPNTLIIAYDDLIGIDSVRLWWLMDMYGHRNFKVLDGGVQNWEEHKFPLTRETPPPRPQTNYVFTESEDYSHLATFDDILAARNDSSVVVVDVRGRGEYSGAFKLGGGFARGTIPWAIWVPHTTSVNSGNLADKTFKTVSEIREAYESQGVTPDKTVILFCHSSIRATVPTLALSQLAGYPNVKIFDDAWMGWSYMHTQDPETYPVILGE